MCNNANKHKHVDFKAQVNINIQKYAYTEKKNIVPNKKKKFKEIELCILYIDIMISRIFHALPSTRFSWNTHAKSNLKIFQ